MKEAAPTTNCAAADIVTMTLLVPVAGATNRHISTSRSVPEVDEKPMRVRAVPAYVMLLTD